MNGAELALRSATSAGVEVCFANPGTTEMELVDAVDRVSGLRAVLGLFEGVVTGAADGYGRVTGRPALTLLHLGPGFANGIANLHNARRARTPVVNLIGDHASWHVGADAPLTSDIVSLATPVSKHVATVPAAARAGTTVLEAVATATSPPTGVATVIVPQDAAWGRAGLHDATAAEPTTFEPDPEAVAEAAARLRQGPAAVLLVGGVVRRAELESAARIRAATGCRVRLDTFPAVLEQGRGLPRFDNVPYFPEQAVDALADVETVVTAGTREPVAFFGYENLGRSRLLPEGCMVTSVAPAGVRGHVGLDALAAELDLDDAPATVDEPDAPVVPTGDLDVMTLGATLAAIQPEGAIVVNESATSGLGWAVSAPGAPPHEVFSLTGGAIGQGLPNAVGAAVAAPDRKVIALQADGSGLYTVQSLWTMARESLDVTVVVCANQVYRILQMEMHRTGHDDAGPEARALLDLHDPAPDWVALARGFGVEAVKAGTVGELRAGIEQGLATEGPFLVEALL
ncbi:MAG: acetolactate synthase large subunit [Acidimicrobiales bacterium]|nr:acetolactate synthase large subunit [Acidimicrobiales bacterium]